MFDRVLKKYNCEVFVSEVSLAEVAFDRELNAAREVSERGYSIRTLSGQRLGSASSNLFVTNEIEKTAEESIDTGRCTKQLPKSFSFTDKMGCSLVSGTYDKSIDKALCAQATEIAINALECAEKNNVLVTDGRSRAVSFKYRVMNSLGIEKEEKGTYLTVMIDAKPITDKPIAEVPLVFRDRIYDKKKYSLWLNEKMGLVSRFVMPRKIPTGKYDLLLSPDVFGPLLLDTVGTWPSGLMRLEGTGQFKKTGDVVAPNGFSAAMDGTYPGGLSTYSVDFEGNKTTKGKIIENGVFKKYYYDQKYASYFNESSTGNAMRSSSLGAEKIFAGTTHCCAQNLIVSGGAEKAEDLLSDMKGIFVENVGIASADSETGAFGFELRNAFLVNKGEFTPARYAVYSGTVQDLLKEAKFTKETGQVSETHESEFSSSCVCPYVFLEKQDVAGATKRGS